MEPGGGELRIRQLPESDFINCGIGWRWQLLSAAGATGGHNEGTRPLGIPRVADRVAHAVSLRLRTSGSVKVRKALQDIWTLSP